VTDEQKNIELFSSRLPPGGLRSHHRYHCCTSLSFSDMINDIAARGAENSGENRPYAPR